MDDANDIMFPCHESRKHIFCKLVLEQFDRSLDDIVMINNPTFKFTNAIPPNQTERIGATYSSQTVYEDETAAPDSDSEKQYPPTELKNRLGNLLDYLLEEFDLNDMESKTLKMLADKRAENGRKQRIIQSRYPWTMTQKVKNTPSESNTGTQGQDDDGSNMQVGDGDGDGEIHGDFNTRFLFLLLVMLLLGCFSLFKKYVWGNEPTMQNIPPWNMLEHTLEADAVVLKRFWDEDADSTDTLEVLNTVI